MNIQIYQDIIRIVSTSKNGFETTISIDRKTGAIKKGSIGDESFSSNQQSSILINRMKISALFGTFIIPGKSSRKNSQRYLVACTESEEVGTLPRSSEPVFKVRKVCLIPYNEETPSISVSSNTYTVDRRSSTAPPPSPEQIEEQRIRSSIEKLLSSGTFFYSADQIGLVTRFQDTPCPEWTNQFLWNYQLACNFICSQNSDVFPPLISPLIQGYFGSRSGMTVITRRSTKQAGTRFNARGIDDDGNVAIFCETDTVIVNSRKECVFAYTVIRGSVPVFWAQSANSGTVEIIRNFELTKNACDYHIKMLEARYKSPIVFVNLLSNTKSGETQLSNAMANHIARAAPGVCALVEFDFHKNVDQSRKIEHSLEPLMEKLRPFIFHSSYWGNNDDDGGTKYQTGILRVNCLDCLDRTNIVQMMIVKEAMRFFSSSSIGHKELDLEKILLSENFYDNVFTELWIKNGDAISKGYSGTGSVLSRLVRNAGKQSSSAQLTTVLEHSWRSANRYIKGNWDDGERNEAMMRILEVHNTKISPTVSPPHSPPPLTSSPKLSLWMGTWNVHGLRLDTVGLGVLKGWVNNLSDILVFNFQEVVDLNSISTVLFSSRGDDERNRSIDVEIVKHLSFLNGGDYVQVTVESMVGLYTCVFIKREYVDQIDHVKTARLKAGFGGATGNKGAVSVTFRLFKQLEIDVINIHLDSGEFRAEERMNQLGYILSNTRAAAGGGSRHMQSHPTDKLVLIGGDFNFRCDGIDPLLALELVDRNRLEKLRIFDPFLSTNKNVLKICQFKEMPLLFPPTYKYEPGTTMLSDKRTPSWCDRIFYRMTPTLGRFAVDPKDYASVPSNTYSDHKPVFAVFELSSIPVEQSENILHHSTSLPDLQQLREEKQAPLLIDLMSGDVASSPISEVPSRTFESSASSATGGEWTLEEQQQSSPPPPLSNPNDIPDLLL